MAKVIGEIVCEETEEPSPHRVIGQVDETILVDALVEVEGEVTTAKSENVLVRVEDIERLEHKGEHARVDRSDRVVESETAFASQENQRVFEEHQNEEPERSLKLFSTVFL